MMVRYAYQKILELIVLQLSIQSQKQLGELMCNKNQKFNVASQSLFVS